MCDAIQGVPTRPSAVARPAAPISYEKPVAVEVAMGNFAKWYKDEYIDTCLSIPLAQPNVLDPTNRRKVCHDNFKYDEYKPKGSIGCLESYNTSMVMYKDLSTNNTFNRQWFWMLCNEPFYYWQTGAPLGQPSLVSRLVTPEYYQRQCSLFFPTQDNYTFSGVHKRGRGRQQTINQLNGKTGGWLLNDTQRLIWVNG